MEAFWARLKHVLDTKQQEGSLRVLRGDANPTSADFFSNDYLSYARDHSLATGIAQVLDRYQPVLAGHGATGARLLSGAQTLALDLEAMLARHFSAPAALLFNSGYVANLGILQALVGRHDVVLYDQLCHASLREGLRLTHGRSFGFAHNQVEALETLLQKHAQTHSGGQVFVLVESLYSMDGDWCPLTEIVTLAEKYGAMVILDEAHSTGIIGPHGAGWAVHLGLQDCVAVRMHSFGKGPGVHGAAVVGPEVLIQYLLNHARSFIYTTMLPPHALASIMASFELRHTQEHRMHQLYDRYEWWQQTVAALGLEQAVTVNKGPIQCISTLGNAHARAVATQLQQSGFEVRPVLSPTVPAGQERIRVCLHLHNTQEQIQNLLQAVAASF